VAGVLEGTDEAMGVQLATGTGAAAGGVDGGEAGGGTVVRGSQIRFVHIPRHVDVARAIEQMRKRKALARRKYR